MKHLEKIHDSAVCTVCGLLFVLMLAPIISGCGGASDAEIPAPPADNAILHAAPPVFGNRPSAPGRGGQGIRPGEQPGERPADTGDTTVPESPETTPGEQGGSDVALPIPGMGTGETGTENTTAEPGEQPGEDVPLIVTEEDVPDLIKQAGFDMIYPNFNRDTGRRDPFVPVSAWEADWDPIKRVSGESFRVIGTAMTPSGQIAMVSIMEQTKVVREGDVLENGSVVKSISPYDVVLEKDGRELRLTMFTRRRVARMEGESEGLKIQELDNIQDLYKKYLEGKYGEEVEGREGEVARPRTFSTYLDDQRKNQPESKKLIEE